MFMLTGRVEEFKATLEKRGIIKQAYIAFLEQSLKIALATGIVKPDSTIYDLDSEKLKEIALLHNFQDAVRLRYIPEGKGLESLTPEIEIKMKNGGFWRDYLADGRYL